MGGSVSRYPDGQLAMPVFDNGGSQASSESYAVFKVQCVPFRTYFVYCYKLHIIFIW